jgi:glycosyltransferase involved in cell wall biosynthesis
MKVIKNPELKFKMIQNGLRRVQNFSWNLHSSRILDLISNKTVDNK